MKKILLIGASSKIAQHFINKFEDNYEVFGTYNSNNFYKRDDTYHYIKLDLTNKDQVNDVVDRVKHHNFYAVFILSSTYQKDNESITDYLDCAYKDIFVNALSPVAICRRLNYDQTATIFLFGDSGIDVPKKDFSSYSITKGILHSISKILAVELTNKARVITFKLGPTLVSLNADSENYYNRTLYSVNIPVEGLVNYASFLMNEDNLNMTGAEISYDGGSYLRRCP